MIRTIPSGGFESVAVAMDRSAVRKVSYGDLSAAEPTVGGGTRRSAKSAWPGPPIRRCGRLVDFDVRIEVNCQCLDRASQEHARIVLNS